MQYRAEIDGLRAIAVLAVLVYHAQFVVAGHDLLPGGFLGVDVFFVISGYLISSILLKAMDAGTFSFADFYARRARRILPMLFLVVACTVPAAMALMGLQALREYFLSAVAALWSGANFVFWLQDGYYAEPSALKPLLVNLALLLAAFALAVLSYRWFEKPLRFSRGLGIGRFLRGAAATCGVLSVGLALGYADVGQRLGRYEIAGVAYDVAAEMQKRFALLREDCAALGWDRCAEPLAGHVNILIVGDSLVDDAYNVFRALYPDYHFVRSTLGGCPPHPDIVALIDFELPDLQQCLALNNARFTPEALAGFDGVVIDNHYEWFTPQDLEPYLTFLGEQGMSHVLLLGNYLGLAVDLPDLYRDTALALSYAGLRDAGRLAVDFDYEPALAALAEHHGVEYLDLQAALCADGDCPLLVGAYPFTWDKFHFSLEFAQFLAQRLKPRLQASWLDALAHQDTAQGDF